MVLSPMSWLIHDIHSAKLIGQKSDVNDMMTSDMTPDANGNFGKDLANKDRTSKERPTAKSGNKLINNRVSDTHAVSVIATTELPKHWNSSRKPEYSSEAIKSNKDNMIDSDQIKLGRWSCNGVGNEIHFNRLS